MYGYPKKQLFLLQNDYIKARVTKTDSPYQIERQNSPQKVRYY